MARVTEISKQVADEYPPGSRICIQDKQGISCLAEVEEYNLYQENMQVRRPCHGPKSHMFAMDFDEIKIHTLDRVTCLQCLQHWEYIESRIKENAA